MQGKIALVTGATSGIGRVTAQALVEKGAHVVFTTRDAGRGRETVEALRRVVPEARVDVIQTDLSEMRQVVAAAAEFKRRFSRLDVLVNNAGAVYTRRETTSEGLERTFATNHLAYFLLTRELLDVLRDGAPSRIVNVASDAHRRGRMKFDDLQMERRYFHWAAYCQSKLANVLFTRELARRLEGSGVTANCLHPGVVATGFGKNTPGAFKWVMTLANRFFITPEEGARTSIFLASAPEVAGKSGGYFQRCQEVTPSRAARDADAAARLWVASEELVARALAARTAGSAAGFSSAAAQ